MDFGIKEVLYVGCGGFAGSVARLFVSYAFGPLSIASGVPVGTFAVNVLGSFAIGLCMALSAHSPWLLVLATGFCGGFTTFSTFSAETFVLLRQGEIWAGVGYALVSVVVCVAMVMAGMWAVGKLR